MINIFEDYEQDNSEKTWFLKQLRDSIAARLYQKEWDKVLALLEDSQIYGNEEERNTINHAILDQTGKDGWSLLHIACRMKAPLQVIQKIVELGDICSLYQRDRDGYTPLHFSIHCCETLPLHYQVHCCQSSCLHVIQFLIKADKMKQTVKLRSKFGHTPLHVAVFKGERLSIVKMLVEAENDTSESILLRKDNAGHTPLWYAALRLSSHNEGMTPGSEEPYLAETFPLSQVLRYLLSKTYKCLKRLHNNVRNGNNEESKEISLYDVSILHAAIYCAHENLMSQSQAIKIVEIIAQSDPAQLTMSDEYGNLPLHLVAESYYFSGRFLEESPTNVGELMRTEKRFNIIELMLKGFPGASTRYNTFGALPLHVALRRGKNWHEDGVELLWSAFPQSGGTLHKRSGLYPFMIAGFDSNCDQDASKVDCCLSLPHVQFCGEIMSDVRVFEERCSCAKRGICSISDRKNPCLTSVYMLIREFPQLVNPCISETQ